ncbi:acetylcholine receptor subunit alpha-like 1 isoform X1 [Metopolophium dirhodum]|uniref:acetylcholine receptor subunit alpha-like 1 isoform X1 n=2 Tax=Metopolophium dirhodum TaxID=44670 RepID=UPI0029903C73|nr:acetylcholine receptor subunit alpha-like 1 isoform X1 [Metopolophium dirhodum]
MLCTRHIGLFVIIIATQATHLWAFFRTVQIYNHNSTVEHILRKNIFKNYDKIVKPYAPQDKNSLEVNMKMLVKSAELNYEKSQMILSTWFIANWIDDRLTWNPSEYEHLNSIIVDHREIWHPDIMAFNNVDANMEDDRTHVNSVLNRSGGVIWVEPVQYIIHCKTDTTNWPHDTQTGVLKLGSWLYLGRDLNLTIDEGEEVEMASSHSEWDITNVSKERNIRYYDCCPDEQYIDIEYNITIRRKVHPYKSVLYIPALCSISFNLLTFWLPYSDNQSKLFVNLFNALFVTMAIMVVYTKVPIVTSTVPLIVVYYTYSLGLIATTAVLSMAVKGMSVVSKPLPHGVTWFLHSGYLVYLGIEINGSAADCHMLCESEEMIAQTADLNERHKLAKVIDRICFVVFAFIYLILLLRLMP